MKNGIYNRKHILKKGDFQLYSQEMYFYTKSHPFSQILSSFGLKFSATF